MRKLILAAALLAVSTPAAVYAADAPKFSVATTKIADLMANEEAKAVLEKRMPQIVQYAGQLGGQTLKDLQAMAQGQLPDATLAEIDADLAKIK